MPDKFSPDDINGRIVALRETHAKQDHEARADGYFHVGAAGELLLQAVAGELAAARRQIADLQEANAPVVEFNDGRFEELTNG